MRARTVSAACCISSSGSRIGAMRWATEESKPICSARCRLSASARRRASFARRPSRARSAARAACSWASTSRRVDSSSWAARRASTRRMAQLVEREQGLQAFGLGLVVDESGHRHRSRARILARLVDRARPTTHVQRGLAGLLGEQALDVSRGQPHEERVEGPGAVGPDLVRGPASRSRERPRPFLHDGVAVRSELLRHPLERRRQLLHRAFSPRCRHAMPPVRSCQRTFT